MNKGCFIMIDGIDGSGKSTIMNVWKKQLTEQANPLFDLREAWKERGTHPEFNELTSYDFIFSAEPTYIGIGKTIREELIKNGNQYSELAIAQAYSLDRLILYTKLLIPVLRDEKCVIQDRGVSTSLCYQTLSGNLPLQTIASLPGNALALEHRPDHLIIFTIDPEEAIKRLPGRFSKQDNAIFEQLDFLKKASAMFLSDEYRLLFEAHGTTVHYLPAAAAPAIMEQNARALLAQLLSL